MDLKQIISDLKDYNKNLCSVFQNHYVILQTLNYVGMHPFDALKIAENIQKLESVKLKLPHNFNEYITLIKEVQTIHESSQIIFKLVIDINIVAEMGSSFSEGEKLDESLSLLKKEYMRFQNYYRKIDILKFSEDYIQSEINEDLLLEILNYEDVYKLLPLIKYILKFIPFTQKIKIKIEDLKDNLLSPSFKTLKDDFKDAPNVVQSLITYQGLIPGTPTLPLKELAKTYMQVDFNGDFKVFKSLNFGVIIIFKILPVAIDYHFWQLTNKNYIMKHNLNKPITRGVDEDAIKRFTTIDIHDVASDVKDQIMVIKNAQHNFILETIDGVNFSLLKHFNSENLLCQNVKFKPSKRVAAYNAHINAEIEQYIKKPYYDPTVQKTIENIETHGMMIRHQILDDFRKNKDIGVIKFFENYNYEKLLFKSVAHIIEKLPSEFILPYLNYEFLNLYAYDIEKFKNKIKKGILSDLMQMLDHNDKNVEMVVERNVKKMLIMDKNNLYTDLATRLELLISLF